MQRIALRACYVLVACGAVSAAAEPLAYLDLPAALAKLPDDSALRYDAVKFVASLQGLVNRDAPRLAVRFVEGPGRGGSINTDDYWLGVLQRGWLKDTPVERMDDFDAVVARFAPRAAGVVLWDPAVPATANVAATVCGAEGLLPVRAGGALYDRVVAGGPQLAVKRSLAGQFDGRASGSAKADAYRWALREYLEAGKTNPTLMAYYVDAYTQTPGQPGFHYPDLCNACVVNHDYYVAEGAFFFDLSPWDDEAPVDDPQQPLGLDRQVFLEILRAQYRRNGGTAFTSVGGFTPWNQKYTNAAPNGGKHDPVPTEWEHAALLSAHNAIMDADALGLSCLANSSAWRHFPLQARYAPNPPPPVPPLEDKTYALVYMGDYDSAAWLSRTVPQLWEDPARGSLPMAWAFNPNLAARVPHVFDHCFATKTPNDFFIGGDSGAGYLNPNLLVRGRLGSGLPDALDLWAAHNRAWYDRFGYTITGFVINGFHGDMPRRIQHAYAQFSPGGVGMQLGFSAPVVDATVFHRHTADLYPDPADVAPAADRMALYNIGRFPRFHIFRLILQTPSTVKALQDAVIARHPDQRWVFLDPHSFFALRKQALERAG